VYTAGDVVEIVRNEGVSKGVLLHKVKECNSEHPRWIVAVGSNRRNEEVCEKSLGKIVESRASQTTQRIVAEENEKIIGGDKGKDVTKVTSTSSSEDRSLSSAADPSRKSRSKVTFVDNIFTGKKRSVSAGAIRVQDSKRLKSKKQPGPRVSTRSSTRSNRGGEQLMTELPSTLRKGGSKPKRPKKSKDVIEVKMLTGTLYLYHGAHRRAEFVWSR